eukprot:870704-Pelagomonas_calceolata.AAC.1
MQTRLLSVRGNAGNGKIFRGIPTEVLVYTQMQVHTHNGQACTLNEIDHMTAVNIQHCAHKLSLMHTVCNKQRGRACTHTGLTRRRMQQSKDRSKD